MRRETGIYQFCTHKYTNTCIHLLQMASVNSTSTIDLCVDIQFAIPNFLGNLYPAAKCMYHKIGKARQLLLERSSRGVKIFQRKIQNGRG